MHAGDCFSRLDYSGQTNNLGVGLPMATKNRESWPLKQPLLANPALKPSPQLIQACKQRFLTLLKIRCSPPSAMHIVRQLHLPINCCLTMQDRRSCVVPGCLGDERHIMGCSLVILRLEESSLAI